MKILFFLSMLLSYSFACVTQNCVIYVSPNSGDPIANDFTSQIIEDLLNVNEKSIQYSLPKDIDVEPFNNSYFDLTLTFPLDINIQPLVGLNNIFDFARTNLNGISTQLGISTEELVSKFVYQSVTKEDEDIFNNSPEKEFIYELEEKVRELLASNLDEVRYANKIKLLLEDNKRVVSLPYSIGSALENNSIDFLKSSTSLDLINNYYGTLHLAPALGFNHIQSQNSSYIIYNSDLISRALSPNLDYNYLTRNTNILNIIDNHYLLNAYLNEEKTINSRDLNKNIFSKQTTEAIYFEIAVVFNSLSALPINKLTKEVDIIIDGIGNILTGDSIAVNKLKSSIYVLNNFIEEQTGTIKNQITVIDLITESVIEEISLKDNFSYNGLKIDSKGNLALLGFDREFEKQFFYSINLTTKEIDFELEIEFDFFQIASNTTQGFGVNESNIYYFISVDPYTGQSKLNEIDINGKVLIKDYGIPTTYQITEIEINRDFRFIGKYRSTDTINVSSLFLGQFNKEGTDLEFNLTSLLNGNIVSQSAIDNQNDLYYISDILNSVNNINVYDSINGEFIYTIPDFPSTGRNLVTDNNGNLYGIKIGDENQTQLFRLKSESEVNN